MSNLRVQGGSGRWLGLFGGGDPLADRLVLLCHPTPGSGAFDPDPIATNRWGVHLLGLDRPGYGASEPLPPDQLSLNAWVDDVAGYVEVAAGNADRISGADYRTFGVIGWGTGGAVASALAARYPDRVDRLALVAVPRPKELRKAARRALIAPRSLQALHVSDDDPDLQRLGLGSRALRMIDEGYRQGRAGIESDRVLMADRSWSDGLADVRAATRVIVGTGDPLAGPSDAHWYARRIRGSEVQVVPDSGHLVVASAWDDVLRHVAPDNGRIAQQYRDRGPVQLADPRPKPPGSAPTP